MKEPKSPQQCAGVSLRCHEIRNKELHDKITKVHNKKELSFLFKYFFSVLF